MIKKVYVNIRSRDRRRSSRERMREKTPDGPAPSEDDRDERTVFCMQLSQRIRSHDLEEFFSAVGKVREVKLIADKHSKRSKGIAYVEFRNMESVPLALGLNKSSKYIVLYKINWFESLKINKFL